MGVGECVRVWAGVSVYGCVCACVGECARVCTGARGCVWLCACVWDEFLGFLLENRVPTSADFNTYPIRIFSANLQFFM